MKKIKKLMCLMCLFGLTLLMIPFAACGGDGDDTGDKTTYTFEAVYTDLSGVTGAGWSGGGGGLDSVGIDEGEWNSSSGYYLTYLYKEDSTITFEIDSDAAVSDAKIVARLTAESGSGALSNSMTLTKDIYKITVNDNALEYEDIVFNNIVPNTPNKFKDYTVGVNVSLVKGKNVIKLITNNSISLGGTTKATAPVVDCIKITTAAKLTWQPLLSNLDEI